VDERVIAIVQARMGSRRLPGKALADIHGRPSLWYLIERVKRADTLHKVVVATTLRTEDRAIVDLAAACGVGFACGAEDDVVDRFMQVAEMDGAGHVVRLTGDNPLVDPLELDSLVRFHVSSDADYSCNERHPEGLPDGLGSEVFSIGALRRIHREARTPEQREHVRAMVLEAPHAFKVALLAAPFGVRHPEIVITVDTPDDLAAMRNIVGALRDSGIDPVAARPAQIIRAHSLRHA
jgi:spore coat polysaccharide biosynthesis protein SpsF